MTSSATSTSYYDSLYDATHTKETKVRKATMNRNGSSSIDNAGDLSSFGASSELDKDAFLNLLVTQLQYQDPMNPEADTSFVAQLAQFSSLESMESVESAVTSLSDSMGDFMTLQNQNSQNNANTAATNLLGKSVRVSVDEVSWKEEDVSMKIQLTKETDSAVVVIRNSGGDVVKYDRIDFEEGSLEGSYVWNGTTESGSKAKEGTYTVEIVDDTKLNEIGTVFKDGTVDGLVYGSEGTKISVDGSGFYLKDIMAVAEIDAEEG